jgi:hypothetical protein
MKRLFAILLLAVVAASAADWVEYGRATDGMLAFYDKNSVQYSAGPGSEEHVTVWAKDVDSDGSYTISHWQLARTARMHRILTFAGYTANGQTRNSSTVPGPWVEIIPDTIGEGLYNVLFKPRDSSKKP